MTYNRTEAARALLREVSVWCVDTGTREAVIGHMLFLHPGFVGLLRKRLTLSEEKERAVKDFLLAHPNGWRGDLPKTHCNGTRPVKPGEASCPRKPQPPINYGEPRQVERDACQRCGVRADIGCKHNRAPIGMTF